MSPEVVAILENLRERGCHVSINDAHPWDAGRWSCMLGHYMTPRWPQVHATGATIEAAVLEAHKLALSSHDPEAAETAVIYVPVSA